MQADWLLCTAAGGDRATLTGEPLSNIHPFDDFHSLLGQLPQFDTREFDAALAKFALNNDGASGGRLGEIAAWFASVAGAARPVMRPQVAIFAGTHGVLRHGISRRPLSATMLAVESCGNGSAAISRLCQANELGLKVYDLALDMPTGDITQEPSLDERGCAATMAFGMEALMDKPDILCLGSFGSGSSTVAAALLAALHGGPTDEWLDRGDVELFDLRKAVADRVLELHGPYCRDPLEALRRIGGREFAAIAGAILAARMERVPVVLHGHAALAAAAVLAAANPEALHHCALAESPANDRASELTEVLGLRSIFQAGFGCPGEQPLSGAFALIAVKGAVACAL